MIEFEQVSKRYRLAGGYRDALRRINLQLHPGEMTFLTGHSGAGKSTLLKLIMMIERPTAGDIRIDGQSLNRTGNAGIPYLRRRIGMVHQNHQLLFDRTVFDNVALPLVIAGFSPRDIGARVNAALDKVGLLQKRALNPMMLSGGEQQRVGIARAVVNKPPLLLADEPTGNLDPELSADIMNLFAEFAQVGVTVLIATHDLDLIQHYSHRWMALREGELVQDVVSR
ncbi:MAG TPA: cell division ATP-binding protein FtsE [Alcanivoracaceae bacterium]|nr:cell division ATP-binding protein FtsE [Alcanivoracaceae bacterium]